jgi:hypothetical protein
MYFRHQHQFASLGSQGVTFIAFFVVVVLCSNADLIQGLVQGQVKNDKLGQ